MAQHKQALKKLEENDPEFYDFLKKEDQTLLNFADSDISEDDDDDDDVESDDEGVGKMEIAPVHYDIEEDDEEDEDEEGETVDGDKKKSKKAAKKADKEKKKKKEKKRKEELFHKPDLKEKVFCCRGRGGGGRAGGASCYLKCSLQYSLLIFKSNTFQKIVQVTDHMIFHQSLCLIYSSKCTAMRRTSRKRRMTRKRRRTRRDRSRSP